MQHMEQRLTTESNAETNNAARVHERNFTCWIITRGGSKWSSAWWVISAKLIDVSCTIHRNEACWRAEFPQKTVLYFVDKVGTFGVASASYWWGRIAAAGLRLVHELVRDSQWRC